MEFHCTHADVTRSYMLLLEYGMVIETLYSRCFSTMVVTNQWTGPLEWPTGLD